MANYKKSGQFSFPANLAARAVTSALKGLGWDITHVDDEIGTVTARQNQPKIHGSDTWHFDFRFAMDWEEEELATPVNVEVTETNYEWSVGECERQCLAAIEAIEKDGLRLLRKAGTSTPFGARWATPAELVEANYIGDVECGKELIVTRGDQFFLRLPEGETLRHALVCGPTGSGKTTGVFIPNLIERVNCSALVTEATGSKGVADLFNKTSGFRASMGHQVYYFNPDSRHSHQINPLDFVDTYREARRVCEIVMQSTTLKTHKGDQSWEMAERMLLTSLILHAVSQKESGNANIGYINGLMNDGIQGLKEVLPESPIMEARVAFNRFMTTATEGYRNLVINGLMSRLDLWNDPPIREVTAKTSVDFEGLKDSLWTIYLAVPADKDEFKPLAALILNYMLGYVLKTQFVHPLMLVLDEFTNYGHIRGMTQKLSLNFRHDRIPAMIGVQNFAQVEDVYDRAAKIILSQPATRVFFKPNDYETAQHISKMLDSMEREKVAVTSSGQLHKEKERKPLLTAGELLNLGVIDESKKVREDKPHMIVFLPNTRPVNVKALSWVDYEHATNPEVYPPVPIPVLEGKEELTWVNQSSRDSKDEDGSDRSGDGEDPDLVKDRDVDKSDEVRDPLGDW
jgi:type IV secretory pathway TraG/TraD family ATPase VirD4